MAPVTVGEHGGEGGRRPPALGCSGDGGRRGGGRDWASGSDVERSGDETQRKAVGSDGSAVDAGIAAAAMTRNCATTTRRKEKCFCYSFLDGEEEQTRVAPQFQATDERAHRIIVILKYGVHE